MSQIIITIQTAVGGFIIHQSGSAARSPEVITSETKLIKRLREILAQENEVVTQDDEAVQLNG